jgi:hypothetical protein
VGVFFLYQIDAGRPQTQRIFSSHHNKFGTIFVLYIVNIGTQLRTFGLFNHLILFIMAKKLSMKETDLFVSIANNLISAYCEKYPDEFEFETASIGYLNDGTIVSANGDDLADTLEWVNNEVIPNLIH